MRKKQTMDGNHAAAHVSYAFTEVAAIYPITPSSPMAEAADEWAMKGRKNVFGNVVKVTELQSEAGAAGTVHGSLAAGALTTTFTASQGLLLMIPNIYKITGEFLPGVFNVAARTIAGHALSIFGDHSDVYACRQTGAAMLCTNSVQEVMDLGPVAHGAALTGRIPFIHFFDGFRTSHEMQKIEAWDYEDLKDIVDQDALKKFRKNALNPNNPKQMGSAQNADIFFQAKEASNTTYMELPQIVQDYMDKINKKIGTDYKLFNYYGAADATHVIIAMGSVCETIEETIDFLNNNGAKVGLIKVHLYRPFCADALINAIPDSVKTISVLDRTKEPGSLGEPLYLDVVAALRDTKFHNTPILSGRYGLSSKNTTPEQIAAVYKNTEKKRFTIGIIDDVTNLSLADEPYLGSAPKDTISCKFWGIGSDGTVGANKNSVKIIGDNTDMFAQAYFDYDSKKSGGITVSHLRFGKSPIKSTYLIKKADFVACHNPSYLYKYNMVQDLKDNGTFLLNSSTSAEDIGNDLPGQVKRYLAEHNIRFALIDGFNIGKELGLGTRINTILQSAFFKLANIIPEEEAIAYMKTAAKKTYEKKGEKVVQMNYDAIDRGATGFTIVEIPEDWKTCTDAPLNFIEAKNKDAQSEFVNKIQIPINSQEGNSLPVSTFLPFADGSTPTGTAAFEKRGTAVDIPVWNPDNCIQCNRCAYVCPHAVIRPVALTEAEDQKVPEGMVTLPMTGMPSYKFSIVVSAMDCVGCGSCAAVCPGKMGAKALVMSPLHENAHTQTNFDYARSLPEKPEVIEKFKPTTVKGSQFKQPLLEFSGACAGCGETPYARLITQLFGDRMYIANATGCSSIWGNSAPSTPYTSNAKGQGPAWSNSLFEDAAEFGYGMLLAQNAVRQTLKDKLIEVKSTLKDEDLEAAINVWLESYTNGALNGPATDTMIEKMEASSNKAFEDILEEKQFLSKKSQWIYGGDGWAYDIGFGGLDHVLASGQDINIMVFDTEVYSNTGGQSSKSTQTAAIAKFAAGGKETKKKDLASIAMTYGNVYVAQIAMGSDYNQCIKAIVEAESHQGPSLIIAYAPCIEHGIKSGMTHSQAEEEKAVKSGYWHTFRFNPDLAKEGKPMFSLDSKKPEGNIQEFLEGEVRFNALKMTNPEKADELYERTKELSKERYDYLSNLVSVYSPQELES